MIDGVEHILIKRGISLEQKKPKEVEAMWTYHETNESALYPPNTIVPEKTEPQAVKQDTPLQSEPPVWDKPRVLPVAPTAGPARVKRKLRKEKRGAGWYLGGIYLCGLTAGSVSSAFLNEALMNYTSYFTQTSLSLYRSADDLVQFSSQFLSIFLQLTAVFLLGFCAFGKLALPTLIFAKGLGVGCFWAQFFAQTEFSKGILSELLILGPVELLEITLILLLSSKALQVSAALWDSCREKLCPFLKKRSRQLVNCYLISCLVALIPCALSVFLIKQFGAMCGIL